VLVPVSMFLLTVSSVLNHCKGDRCYGEMCGVCVVSFFTVENKRLVSLFVWIV
jgi:hypothetical protein